MLKKLQVSNYAIIEDLTLDFFEGMTVLTGETGAGKSIIVDAISLLLGDRASKDMIASNKTKATVIGTFILDNSNIKHILKKYEIDYEQDIVIERTINQENKNIVKINNQVSSLKVLKELAIHLADIHSQFDTNRLINPDNYLALIDNYRKEKVSSYLLDYNNDLEAYKQVYSKYNKALKEKENTLKQLDLYTFQLKELTDLDLTQNEDEILAEQISLLENIDKINSVLEKFNTVTNEERVLDNIYDLKSDIETIEDTSSDFKEITKRLNDIYYEFEDIQQVLNDKLHHLDYNQNDYDDLIERSNLIDRLKRKYNKSVNELIEYKQYLENEVEKVDNYEEYISSIHQELLVCFNQLAETATRLRQFRKDIAKKITKEIKETLHDLVILNADFEIRFSEDLASDEFDSSFFKPDGIDTIDFYISTNIGEPLKQLSKTASGGEMSRVMLAFKSIFVRSNKISTIIFDEIDTGISGYIAKQIANKIREISQISQVISITHIPQVVATGTHHIAVTKSIEKDKTKTKVTYLDYENRIVEIAKMISAGNVTKSSLESAKELLISE
ncbi:DNA repair protein RecN [Candidatus Izemoplasma sp. B36]|uniref:DNA repair protein RecN n=1 Tax=Candidatus Izemoplasma sp. B36 TaxID=3242468 RepID=UPI003556A89E